MGYNGPEPKRLRPAPPPPPPAPKYAVTPRAEASPEPARQSGLVPFLLGLFLGSHS